MNKFFLKSKAIIGAILLMLSTFGINIPVDNEEVANILTLAQELIGALLVIWGRFTADKKLGFSIK